MEDDEVMAYIAFLAAGLASQAEFDPNVWADVLGPYLEQVPALRKGETKEESKTKDDAVSFQSILYNFCQAAERELSNMDENDSYGGHDDDEEEICDLRFNLAYGGKILLHQTKLRLLKGRRYALVGQNGVGKTVRANSKFCLP